MFSLESPHPGDSNENTKYTIFKIKKKIIINYPKSAAVGFFLGTQERVRLLLCCFFTSTLNIYGHVGTVS